MNLSVERDALGEAEVFTVLGNARRRATIRYLEAAPAVTVGELAAAVAAVESGESPPPRRARESVYASLHQTHLPKLHELGVLDYDRSTGEVRRLDNARQVGRYMEAVTRFGVSWGEYYRGLGVLGLFVVVAALVGIPVVSAVDPLLWASVSLGAFAISTGYQLWVTRAPTRSVGRPRAR
jgi:hypothetical protein